VSLEKGTSIYTTKDVIELIGISRATLYNWFRNKKVRDVARDRNNFRVFVAEDVKRISAYKNMIRSPQ
jgi:predicted site-specific integrase-resolvase